MSQQKGFVFKASGAWYLKYREDVLEDGKIVRKLKTHRLADVDDRCRTTSDARKLAKEFLKPLNEGKHDARSTMSLTDFVENHWLPYIKPQVRPATRYGYTRTWESYLKPKFGDEALRDIRKRDVVPFCSNYPRKPAHELQIMRRRSAAWCSTSRCNWKSWTRIPLQASCCRKSKGCNSTIPS